MESLTQYVGKIFPKTNISYPLIRTRDVCVSGVKKCYFFSENFAKVLNKVLLVY